MYNVSFIGGNGKSASIGTPLGVISLQQVLKICEDKWNETIGKGEKYNREKQKGKMGAIFAYTPGTESTTGKLGTIKFTGGVIFIDFDKIPKKHVITILENFEKLLFLGKKPTPVLGIKTSASFADENEPLGGFHVYMASNRLCGDNIGYEYGELVVKGTALFCELVERVCGIKLYDDDNNVDYADKCSTSISQRLFLNPAKCKYNEHALPLTDNTLSKNDLEKLKEKYPKIFDKYLKNKKNSKNNERYDTTIDVKGAFTGKCTLDIIDTHKTEKFGDEYRYPIINLLVYYKFDHKDIVKWMCAKRGRIDGAFKNEIESQCRYAAEVVVPRFTQKDINYSFSIASEWGFIIKHVDKISLEIPEGKYLSEVHGDLIKNELKTHGRILIQAPTGAGKTTTMKDFAAYNPVILVPFNSMLPLYKDFCVLVGTGQDGVYTEDKPVCMVWDRAMKYDLSNRLVISDETHQWFFDRDYRDSAKETLKRAKDWNELLCISATPAGEEKELNLHKLKFTKKRDTINVRWVNSGNSGGYIKDLLDNRDLSTKYLIFSDINAKKLHQNFPGSCLLHSEKKDTLDFKYVMEEEKLNNQVTFCTSIAYCGLNFGNEGKYIVIVDAVEGKDTAGRIIQAVGRLRNANIVEVVVVFSRRDIESKHTVEEKSDVEHIKKNICETIDVGGSITFNEKLINEDDKEALTEIEKYLKEHGPKDVIIGDLIDEGYFSIIQEYDREKHEKLELVEKRAQDNKLKELVKKHEGHIYDINDNELNSTYLRELVRKMCRIEYGITVDWVEHIESREDNCLLETIVVEVEEDIEACNWTDEEFEIYYGEERERTICEWEWNGKKLPAWAQNNIRKSFKRKREIRKKYRIVYKDENELKQKIVNDILAINIKNKKKCLERKTESGKIGGKKGGKKGKSITIQDNKGNILHFDTIKEAAEEFNLAIGTMRKYIKKGKFEVVVEVRKQTYQIVNE